MAEDKLLQRMSDMATYPRVCVKDGVTGRAILEGLMKAIKQTDIQVFENVMATRLLTKEGAVVGAVGIRLETGDLLLFKAKSTILATGGAGCVFLFNAFTPEMTGDGYAMAYDVGAKLINMEFIQMGPAIVHPIIRVISGPLWRFNPELYNVLGEKFLERYLPSNVTSSEVFKLKAFPFSTRNSAMFLDIAIYSEIKFGRGTEHGGIFFDVTHASEEEFEQIAPITFKDMLSYGIDLRKQPVEIGIVAQNFGGGVKINEKAETGIPGLYAAGEVAGGLRGPDRPGGNALAECQVFGARAGRYATKRAKKVGDPVLDLMQVEREVKRINNILNGEVEPRVIRKRIQRIMWEEAFIIRNGAGLKRALNELREIEEKWLPYIHSSKRELFEALSLRNLVIVGKAIVLAALTREESRGSHYREDFPKKDEKWLKYISIYRANKGMKQRIVKPRNLLPAVCL
jgi:fumarate reductase (CoM/CoB) subunit A